MTREELVEDVKDCEKALAQDQQCLRDALEWVNKDEKCLAEAKLALAAYDKTH